MTNDTANRNGVDTATLFATLDAVKQAPAAAKFQFRAHTAGSEAPTAGAPSRTSSVSAKSARTSARSPSTPIIRRCSSAATTVRPRWNSCSTPWPAASPPAWRTSPPRGVTMTKVTTTVEGDIDLNGILGLDAEVRNGYEQITVRFQVEADAPAETVAQIVEQSKARSAVYDVITNSVPVSIEVDAV